MGRASGELAELAERVERRLAALISSKDRNSTLGLFPVASGAFAVEYGEIPPLQMSGASGSCTIGSKTD